MDVGIHQHKGNINKWNQLKISAIIMKESLGLLNRYTAKIYEELATAKPLVEFFLK
jgi:hypothetical protein